MRSRPQLELDKSRGPGHDRAMNKPGVVSRSRGMAKLRKMPASWLDAYLAKKRAFNRRRKSRIDFDTLYELFARGATSAEIAKRAHVSKERINVIFNHHFSALFGMSALERRRRREQAWQENRARQRALRIRNDRVLVAIRKSAQSAKKKKRIDVVLITKASWIKDYRHKAVLVENKSAESVHHIRKARRRRSRRKILYGGTTLYRKILEHSAWTIFVIDVPHYSQRVIRSNNQRLLNTFFSRGQARVAVYIPLDGQPENPRYDFLADEDNWGRRERLDR
jgi:hypothetical protein